MQRGGDRDAARVQSDDRAEGSGDVLGRERGRTIKCKGNCACDL